MAMLLRRCRRPGWIVTSSAPLRRFHVGDKGTRMKNVCFASIATPVTLISRVVIYDGVCNLCNSGLRWVAKKDKHKQIYFCAVQSEAAKPYLYACDLTVNDVLKRFLFIEGLAEFSQGSTAALRVLRYLPLPYSMLSALLVIPVPMRDTVYDYIAKHRYEWFGRTKSCILPDDEILDRFIDRDELKAKFEQSLEDEEM